MSKEAGKPLHLEAKNYVSPYSLGEAAFSHAWRMMAGQKAVENMSADIDSQTALYHAVLGQSGLSITQHSVYVLNTLAAWLGTKAGSVVLQEGNLHKRNSNTLNAYLYAWAVENRRIKWLNRGLRLLEYILLKKHPETEHDPILLPDIKIQDYEIADAFFYWLGSEDGHRFIQNATTWISGVRHTFDIIRTDGPLPIHPDIAYIANQLRDTVKGSMKMDYAVLIANKALPHVELHQGDKIRVFQRLESNQPFSLIFNYRTHNVRMIENAYLADLYSDEVCEGANGRAVSV